MISVCGGKESILCILLWLFALLGAAGGLLLIFGNKPLIVSLFLRPPDSEVSTLLLFLVRELGGGVSLLFSVLLFLASRDPGRNVAILDAFIVGLCILALTPLWSLYTLDIRRL